MAAFIVILLIVIHRFLRLDLTNDVVASIHPPAVLTGILIVTFFLGLARRTVRFRFTRFIMVQGALWAWSMFSKVIADGVGTIVDFIKNDYTKDVIFASLLSMLVDSMRKLRVLAGVFVVMMTFISLLVLPQRDGLKKCFHFRYHGSDVVYEQTTDNRRCASMMDCFELPPAEEHLRNEGWSCEREGPWGIGTVLERIRYVGSLADPNSLALALVMACCLGLGLASWPTQGPLKTRKRVFQWLMWASALLMGVTLIYAASRAAQAAMALAMLTFFYSRIGPLGAGLAGLAAAPLILISRRNEAEVVYSTWTRIQTNLNGYHAFLEDPIFGIGWGNYDRISFITAHNSFLLAATETGAIGCALFMLGVYLAFKLLIQVIRWPVQDDDDDLDESEPPPGSGPVGRLSHWLVQPCSVTELRHFAMALLAMLVGVGGCIAFLSLTFDVMWLFPVGVLAAFYNVVRDRLPLFRLHVYWYEILLLLIGGGVLPGVLVAIATRSW